MLSICNLLKLLVVGIFGMTTCSNISTILTDWDTKLCTMMAQPQSHEGDYLLTSIDDYTCLLWEVRDEVRLLNLTILEDLQSIMSTRLPEFVRMYKKINKQNLYKTYGWGDRKENRLNYLILDSKHLWKTTVELYERQLKELSKT
ncbi:hypothetical protein J6590_026082 [Homalodisca vitripennis]|nr:hypothetical protein J6590_026082 [Homalodisca vitripennis]